MKFKKIMVVAILLLAIFMVGAASATEENVTESTGDILSADDSSDALTVDAVDDELEASPGDFAELQSLVDNTSSGKTLKLNKDYSYAKSNSYVKISKAITIDGQGHTINGKNSGSYIFYISTTSKVSLKNINFENSVNSAVRGYSSSYRCTVNNCSFVGCSASYGGAIFYGNAYDCSFVGCSASNTGGSAYGGAIYYGSATDCSFVGCSASYGGAVYYGSATDCSFVNCSASGNYVYGGAIYYGSATDCSFVNCFASATSIAYGGAIYSGSATDCSFVDCYASTSGGAIYSGNAVNSYFRNCSTKSINAAMAGGKATNCTFVECQASAAIDSITASDITYGSTAYIYVYGDENAGYVNVTVNGETKKIKPYYSGRGVSFSGLAVGTYQVKVTYPGSANFKAQTATTTFKVNKQNPIYEIDITNPSSWSSNHRNYGNVQYTGGSATLYIYMRNSNVPGNVKVCINGETQKVQISKSTLTLPLGVLTLGSYNISVSYAGNANYNAQNISLAFNVIKANPISAIRTDYPYAYSSGNNNYGNVAYDGGNATLTINMKNKNVPGNVNVTINGVSQKVKVSGSTVKVPLGVLKRGNYNITVSYAGSAGFNAQTVSLAFKVVRANPISGITVTPRYPSNNGQVQFTYSPSKIYIYLKSKNIPSVDVKINGVSHVVNTTGIATFAFKWGIMQPGNYNITVSYAGGGDFNAQTKTLIFKVVKARAISEIDIYPYGYWTSSTASRSMTYDGKDATLSIYFNSAGTVDKKTKYAPGKVHVTVNGASHKAVEITKNYISGIPLGILNVGTNVIKVTYSGSAYFNAQELTYTITVNKASNPIKSVAQPATNVGYGENTTIKVNMANDKINGNVWYTISDANKTKLITDKMSIVKGVATASVSGLSMGKYNLHIYFAGNAHYKAQTIKKTFNVVKGTPVASVEVLNWVADGDPTIKVKVNNVNGNIWFTVSDENKTKILTDKIHIEDGWAIASVPNLKVGKYYLHIYYAGNVHYKAQTIKSSFEVTKILPNLSVARTTVDGKAVLTASVPMDARGNINFEVNGSTYKASIVKGEASVTLPDLEPGTYKLTTSYNGNYKYLPATNVRSITIR